MAALITTSRNSSLKTRLLARTIAKEVPGASYFPRGTKTIESAARHARHEGRSLLCVIGETKRLPSGMQLIKVNELDWSFRKKIRLNPEALHSIKSIANHFKPFQ